MALAPVRRSGGRWVQEFSNEIVAIVESALNLAGNATAP
jgi:hypothetical protein